MAQENGKVLKQEGDCINRISAGSTFKIAISLIGYDLGILVDETHPKLPFKEGYADSVKYGDSLTTP